MSKTRLLLVDDHAVLRAGIRMLVENEPDMEVVAETDNVADAERLARAVRPDLLVLDLTLPGGASLPLIERLSAFTDPPKVLVLTMHDDPAYVRAALAAGAVGFLVKKIREQDLLQAIRSVARGRVVVDLDDEQRTASVFQALPRLRSRRPVAKLSTRELEVIRLLGRGLSNQEVAEQLDVSPKTVATYRARIGDKLGLKSTADFVKYALDTGLIAPGK